MAMGRRVKRLRELVDQIERLPASDDRDRLLSEIRSRAVDVETGTTPRAMLPLREPVPTPVLPWPPKRDRTASDTPRAPAPPTAAVSFAPPASAASRLQSLEESFLVGERLLSLEDSLQLSPLPYVRVRGDRAVPPWTLGLRG